jgi:putative ABC transport system permease protein
MTTLLDDFRHARRALAAHPAFAAAVVLILGIAIGANGAVFALVHAVILSPLPYRDADRLVNIDQTRPESTNEPLSIPDFRDLRDGARTFDGMAATFQWSANLTGGEPERLQGMKASASFFQLTGIQAALGRVLVPDDDTGSGARVVVLTDRLWRRRFGGDPAALGGRMVLNGDTYTVVGVLPAAFIAPVRDAELVAPFAIDADPRRNARDAGFLRVTGRLRAGATIAQAQGDLDGIMARLRVQYPQTNATHLGTTIIAWRALVGARQRSLLLLLQGAVALVLLIACANVCNLFLASAIRREPEFAVRTALGASPSRRLRQVLIETSMLTLGAAAVGLAMEAWTARALLVLAPPDVVAGSSPSAWRVPDVLFTFGVMAVSTCAFGLLPAVRLGRPTIRSRGASVGHRRLRSALVAAEVAVAFALVTLAILLSESFANLQAVDPGFRTDRLLTVRLSLPRLIYPGTRDAERFVENLRPLLVALPGVEDAAAVNVVPLNGYHATADVWPADRPTPTPAERPQAQYRMISPSYVRTFGVPLIAGRSFDERDTAGSEPVVLVSRTLASQYWSIGGALDKTMMLQDGGAVRRARIVGVIGDVKHYGLDAEATPDIYVPIPQVPDATVQWLTNNMYWGVRTSGDPGALREPFRRALRGVDRDVPASAMKTMDEALDVALAPRRTNLWLVRAFAALALGLAAAGTYAVTAFSVALRRREMAIRAALGASGRRNIVTMVVDAGRPLGAGLAVGFGAALLGAPILRTLLFGVEPLSAGPLMTVMWTLLSAGLASALAAALPIRRVDPIDALKTE